MISIHTYTSNIFKKEFWKYTLKKIIGKYSGPDAVRDSLLRGLEELEIPYELNAKNPKYKYICVLSGVEVLRERIKCKKEDQTIIAGPNLVITPNDHNSLILNNKINLVITPSKWVADFYLTLAPELKSKIKEWPAGVKIPKIETDRSGKVLLYKKDISNEIYSKVKDILDKLKINYEVLEYEKFSHKEYLNKLKNTPYIIYLQASESQGLALQEAWSYNVPTLVYQNEKMVYKGYTIEAEKLSAPYLTNEAGQFFTLDNLKEILSNLNLNNFDPKRYCEDNLSDKKSTQKYLAIIRNI